MTDAVTTPPLGKILTADEIARFVVRGAYPASPVVLVDEGLALAAPARAYGDGSMRWVCRIWRWRRTLLPETAGGHAAVTLNPGPACSDHFGSVIEEC